MTFEQTAARLAEVERDIRVLKRMREDLVTQLIQEREHLVAGLEHQSAEQPQTARFRVPGFMGRASRELGTATALPPRPVAMAPCPESCCLPMRHWHYVDGSVVQERVREERRERSHRRKL